MVSAIPTDTLSEEPWQFASAETASLITRMRTAHPQELGQVAEIFVGVQTSADAIYIFNIVRERHAEVMTARIESDITALFGLSAEDMEVVRLVEAPS